jgi:hypothetical protein
MEDLNEALKSLNEGDLIRFSYDENSSGNPMRVIARYDSHNQNGKNLRVSAVYPHTPILNSPKSIDTKLQRIGIAKFSEISYLEKLVPERLF